MNFFKNKKAFLIFAVLLLTAVFALGCAESASVGIIGGADGPTSIIVSDGENTPDSDMGGFMGLYTFGIQRYFNASAAYVPILIALYMLSALLAYMLGSLNFGIIISKLFFHDDVRTHGSGNAGTTNMLRTYGKAAALGTIVGDALKVVVAIFLANLLVGSFFGGGYVAGLLAVIGHVYPAFYGFKGGKGVVASAITILMLDPTIFLVVLTVFVVVVAIWRYISLGSILSAAVYPLVVYAAYGERAGLRFLFALCLAIFVIFLHRSNIQRLLDGKENKLSFKKK